MNIYTACNICMSIYGAPNICMNIYEASNIYMNIYTDPNKCMSICRSSDTCMNIDKASDICMNIIVKHMLCHHISSPRDSGGERRRVPSGSTPLVTLLLAPSEADSRWQGGAKEKREGWEAQVSAPPRRPTARQLVLSPPRAPSTHPRR